MKSDAQIQKDVIDQLKWEPILNAAEIGVSVKSGVVTLSGQVDTYSKKIAAEKAAKKVIGVKAVAEDIQVGISPVYRKTDTEVAEAVVNALKWNPSIPDDKIKVKVEDGTVTLEGQLDWNYQRTAVGNAVQNLTGVKYINNYLTVKPTVTPSDVKRKIEAAFQRSATIDADKISVTVVDSRAILTGKVRSFAESEDAQYAAWSAPGINTVENRLQVQQEEYAF
ncbi:MAG TPA: BON domain-containing protein [Chitinophagaceae bacterium]|nr:BON domain-containing protein [Chitinophagaceae bacterium]